MHKVGIGLLSLIISTGVMAEENPDPWVKTNQKVLSFNLGLDDYVLKPVATAYRDYAPQVVNDGISNFFSNLGEINVAFNNVLQFKFKDSAIDVSRFLINTTAGVGGFIEVAGRFGLEKHNEDFGQTLGYWGVGSGPYVMLPFFGPSTVRDTISMIPDFALSPLTYISNPAVSIPVNVVDTVDVRADLLPLDEAIIGDRYIFIRDAFLQSRRFEVLDGNVPDEFDDFGDEFDDEEFDDEDFEEEDFEGDFEPSATDNEDESFNDEDEF